MANVESWKKWEAANQVDELERRCLDMYFEDGAGPTQGDDLLAVIRHVRAAARAEGARQERERAAKAAEMHGQHGLAAVIRGMPEEGKTP